MLVFMIGVRQADGGTAGGGVFGDTDSTGAADDDVCGGIAIGPAIVIIHRVIGYRGIFCGGGCTAGKWAWAVRWTICQVSQKRQFGQKFVIGLIDAERTLEARGDEQIFLSGLRPSDWRARSGWGEANS